VYPPSEHAGIVTHGTLTAYDPMYVALAEALNVPLLTDDAKFAGTPGHHADIHAYPDRTDRQSTPVAQQRRAMRLSDGERRGQSTDRVKCAPGGRRAGAERDAQRLVQRHGASPDAPASP
jgi:hypothetical protein